VFIFARAREAEPRLLDGEDPTAPPLLDDIILFQAWTN